MGDEKNPGKATQKIPAFTDPAAPENLLLGEIRTVIQQQIAVIQQELIAESAKRANENQALRTEVAADLRGLASLMKTNVATMLDAHEVTRRHVSRLTTMTHELWKHNFGEAPPPPGAGGSGDSFALSESDQAIIAAAQKKKPTDSQMRARMDSQDGTIDSLYRHWILGESATRPGPRWSIVRNLLHWVQ